MAQKNSEKNLKEMIAEAMKQLETRNIRLRNITQVTTVWMEGLCRTLPPHDEKEWYAEYFKEQIQEKSFEEATGRSYALLRYKQALVGSADGSLFSSMFAMFHVPTDHARRVYEAALKEYDSAK